MLQFDPFLPLLLFFIDTSLKPLIVCCYFCCLFFFLPWRETTFPAPQLLLLLKWQMYCMKRGIKMNTRQAINSFKCLQIEFDILMHSLIWCQTFWWFLCVQWQKKLFPYDKKNIFSHFERVFLALFTKTELFSYQFRYKF